MAEPRCILLFTGKRKSGKDYVTDVLHSKLGPETSVIIRLSAPIKLHWAETNNLDYELLLSDGDYKEKYRHGMVQWGVEMRDRDNGVFCRRAIEMFGAKGKPVWIISDARYKTDLVWFKENFKEKVKTVRVFADHEVRKNRKWVWTLGIDDVPSECDLDDIESWDFVVKNNGDPDELNEHLESIIQYTKK